MEIKGKRIAIIGFGRSGKALTELILNQKGIVKVSDCAPEEDVRQAVEHAGLKDKIQWEAGQHTKTFLSDCDLLAISPGVRLDAWPIRWAAEKKIPVIGEMELAWMFCRNPVIAVTGSNGKTTVCTLIARILEKSGKPVCLCGNMGSPLAHHVQRLRSQEIVVLEVSSFQLESTFQFRPDVAVLLNCTQNHLDRHKDMEEYFSAKIKIFSYQKADDFAVLTFQDEKIQSLAKNLKAKVVYFDSPMEQQAYPLENLNFLAARKVSQLFGVCDEAISQVFKEFQGVEHRLEWVRTIDGVDFINDSKATTVEAGQWALNSIQKPVVMICGGKDKNLDFSVLKELVRRNVKHMIVIGEASEKISAAFNSVLKVQKASSLKEAVEQAKQCAQIGNCVLFSPMCASFDMFSDFEHRGREFKKTVYDL